MNLALFRHPCAAMLAAVLCLGPASSTAASPVMERELDAFIAQGMKDWKIPGLSIVVVNEKGVLYEKGFGVRELGKPGKVDQHTRFGMMSTTKAMTALALAMLVDEGKLGWDDPVRKHLPTLRLPNAYLTEHVTIRDTLRHTSGVGPGDLMWTREDTSTKDIMARLTGLPVTDSLRSEFNYSNEMYQVAGEIIEAVSGMGWDAFIARRILQPLGMTDSRATARDMLDARLANISIPHAEIDGVIKVMADSPVDAVPAAGGAWSSAHDAGKWMSFLVAGGKVGGTRLVSEASFKELFKPQVILKEAMYPAAALLKSQFQSYGLAWFLQDYRGQFVAMHTGSGPGRTAITGLIPQAKVGVYVFGNLDHAEFRHALLWKALDLSTGAPERDWNGEILRVYGDVKASALGRQAAENSKRITGTKPSQALAAYAGTYHHPTWGDATVALANGALLFRLGPAAEMRGPMQHWHYDTFRTRLGTGIDGWQTLTFGTDKEGNIATINYQDMTFTKPVLATSMPR